VGTDSVLGDAFNRTLVTTGRNGRLFLFIYIYIYIWEQDVLVFGASPLFISSAKGQFNALRTKTSEKN
jgi:hypothetical protein